MEFRNPMAFLLLLPLAAALFKAYYAIAKGKYAARIEFPSKRLMDSDYKGVSPRLFPLAIYFIAGVFFIVALARPQKSFSQVTRNVDGIDMMMVLDLSASMRVEDFRDKNRVDVAKSVIKEFLINRVNDRIGLLTFSGEAVTRVPPTFDHDLLLQSLADAEIGELKDGTAIGDALGATVNRLKESTAKSRIIILVTDGDSNVGIVDPMTAGEMAKSLGIKIYSIGIGSEGRVAMPFIQKDIFGRQVKTYQYFDSSMNPELLKKISEATNGKFYRVQGDETAFREVFREIDTLEKNKVEVKEKVRYHEYFTKFAVIGAMALVAGFLTQFGVARVFP